MLHKTAWKDSFLVAFWSLAARLLVIQLFQNLQVDREAATAERCDEVESSVFDLFAQMGATEEQLDFPVLYASGRQVRHQNLTVQA